MGLRRVALALVVALACVSTAGAQNLDPSSPQNVTPSVAPSGVAGLEAQRKQLFAAMLRNPADLDVAFEYAALSVQLGDLESAISTLERMLIFSPGLPRLQFELGVLYYRLGAYDTAGTYFRTVAANPAVPAEITAQVAAYLAAIESGAAGSGYSAVVATGFRWQSNANAGPDDPTIALNGLTFTLNPGALSTPDVNGYATASLQAAVDLPRQGAQLDMSLTAYGALFRNQTTLNTGIVEMRVGPTFRLARFEMDNVTLGVYGVASAAILGGSLYQGTLGIGSELRAVLDSRSRVILSIEGREVAFFNSPMRPTAALGSGERYTAAATFERQITPRIMAFLTLNGERRTASTAWLSSWKAAGTVGAVIKFDSLIAALAAPWSLGLSAGVRHLTADAPDPVFSATNAKVTTQGFAEVRLTVPLADNFALQSAASYTVSKSNYGLETYNNATASVGLSKGF